MPEVANMHEKDSINQYYFENGSNEQNLDFFHAAIVMQINYLVKKIDPRFLTSATVINQRLKLPIECHYEIGILDQKNIVPDHLLKNIKDHISLLCYSGSVIKQINKKSYENKLTPKSEN
ncbi:hypothetical protein [Facklamia miroungae]|uniref:Uncharacterized protein n=1 Tax=Facklamia miroungae TaxID=120956 RepID=A0A1G7QBR4_9LACT|nr:hypothetical protein [Facklamia miroungae]NKZ28889.1 hypothetical protein [Facklamia miroungae]SDF95865.1 hypothetical protein SAMN05421791_10237 [Facklamia miroungae]